MDFILNISLYCLVGKFQINVFWTNVRVNGFIELSLMADVKLKNNVITSYSIHYTKLYDKAAPAIPLDAPAIAAIAKGANVPPNATIIAVTPTATPIVTAVETIFLPLSPNQSPTLVNHVHPLGSVYIIGIFIQ